MPVSSSTKGRTEGTALAVSTVFFLIRTQILSTANQSAMCYRTHDSVSTNPNTTGQERRDSVFSIQQQIRAHKEQNEEDTYPPVP